MLHVFVVGSPVPTHQLVCDQVSLSLCRLHNEYLGFQPGEVLLFIKYNEFTSATLLCMRACVCVCVCVCVCACACVCAVHATCVGEPVCGTQTQ